MPRYGRVLVVEQCNSQPLSLPRSLTLSPLAHSLSLETELTFCHDSSLHARCLLPTCSEVPERGEGVHDVNVSVGGRARAMHECDCTLS
mmetsp:Transcript_62449/g.146785  ORF Transcript_62449/g.146785 Transcript_62449/m.146785 type:complete len:89 (-) Transcript_62449:71-337(-)